MDEARVRLTDQYGAVSAQEDTFVAVSSDPTPSPASRKRCGIARILLGGFIVAAVVVGVVVGAILGTRRDEDGHHPDGCSYTDYVLRPYAAPSRYNILLRPQFHEPFMFDGVTTVDIAFTTNGQHCVQMHAKGLNVTSILATTTDTSTNVHWRYDTKNERIVVSLPGTFNAGAALTLKIAYHGYLGQDMTGFYLSKYRNSTGGIVNMVSTHFEATSARKAFPCFDEPAYKAVFDVVVDGVPPGYTPVSNMPSISTTTNADGTTKVAFDSTPRMSTYLVAVVVAPLVRVTGMAGVNNNIEVSVFAVAREGNIYNIQYALQQGIAVLTYYEQLFKIPYPLPKLDMVAIPDFAAGAMENWGLVTYRETALLGNTTTSSVSELQRITLVIAHELAHQWFGNLATMAWWSALWLNEAYARRTEYIGTQAVAPEFSIMRQFQATEIMPAMQATWWGHARPLTDNSVSSSAAIEAQFDGVAYSFGASVLSMLEQYLARVAPGTYYNGVTSYLNAHQYGNAEPASLWAAVANSSGIPAIQDYMRGYTDQVGYPIVTVAWITPEGAQSGSGALQVSQSRHFFSGYAKSVAPPDQVDTLWWVPLSIVGEHPGANSPVPEAAAAASAGFTTQTWETTIGTEEQPYSIVSDGYLKLNADAQAFYRVNYPVNMWRALALGARDQLNSGNATGSLTPADRGQLVDDIFVVAEGGIDADVNTPVALEFVQTWLPLDTSYESWTPAVKHFLAVRSLLMPDSAQPDAACWDQLQAFAKSVLTPIVNYVGFNGDQSPLTVLLRTSVLNAASLFNMTDVVDQAAALWAQGIENVPANIQSAVIASVVRWDKTGMIYPEVKQLYENTDDAGIKMRYLLALGASQNPAELQDALEYSLNQQFVRQQDTVSLISAVASNVYGRSLAWQFVKANWGTLLARYGNGKTALANLITATSSQLTSQESFDEVSSFFGQNIPTGAQRAYQQALESVATRVSWRSRDASNTCMWLAAQA